MYNPTNIKDTKCPFCKAPANGGGKGRTRSDGSFSECVEFLCGATASRDYDKTSTIYSGCARAKELLDL